MHRLATACLFMLVPALAFGTTYYVSKSGRDSNTCTQARAVSTAKLTIRQGLSCLSAGDTLIIKAGTYTEGIERDAIPSGSSNTAHTIVRAAAGETVILRPAAPGNSSSDVVTIYDRRYITLDGLILDGRNVGAAGLRIGGGGNGSYSHYITVRDGVVRDVPTNSGITQQGSGGANSNLRILSMEIYNCGNDNRDHGVYLTARNSLVEGNTIYANYGHGIHVYAGGGGASNNIVRENDVFENGSFGILIGSGTNNVAYNNLARNNGRVQVAGGIWTAYYGNTNNRIYNNTIYGNNGYCIRVRTAAGASVRNNICWQNSINRIDDETAAAILSHNLFTNPSFVNATQGVFAVQSGSPAINRGASITEVVDDFDGTPRPQQGTYDIGAFEFSADGTRTPAVPRGVRFY